eukprot:2448599-Prymnesium_polylepis.1
MLALQAPPTGRSLLPSLLLSLTGPCSDGLSTRALATRPARSQRDPRARNAWQDTMGRRHVGARCQQGVGRRRRAGGCE